MKRGRKWRDSDGLESVKLGTNKKENERILRRE